MDDGYSMKKNFSILLNNISINKFRICFKYKVHSFNEFHMSGFSGELTNNFFWIQYRPKHLSPRNIIEWWMPTILEGRIYSQGDEIRICYSFDKHELAKALAYGTIGFAVTMFIKLILRLYLHGYNKMPCFFLAVTMGLAICSLPSVLALVSLHISDDSKRQLEKVLYEIIELGR